MSRATCTQVNRVDSWLLMVGGQITNLTPIPSFGHNLYFRCPNGSYEPILNIYVSISFQWYKLFNPLGFDPYSCFLNVWESIGIPTPNVGIPLGVWRFIPSHSLALPGTCGLIPCFLFGPQPCKPLPWSRAQGRVATLSRINISF